MAKEYKFDPDSHTHTIGGVVVPGITTILKPLHDFSAVPAHVLAASCAFGVAVHRAVELYCNDDLDTGRLDESLEKPLAGFECWLKENRFSRHDFIVELPMGDPGLMVACIPDLILDGKLIVEIKTRKPNLLTDSIQTVCQEHVWKKNGGIRAKEYERRVLYLAPDGAYTYTRVNDKQANSRFRLLLDHYWNAKTIERWKTQ
jgi:hypothetical protein